jgi:hypothetical protein
MTTPEGEGAQSGAEGTQSGAGGTSGNTNDNPNPKPETGSQSGTEDAVAKEKAAAESYRARMQAADKRAADLEAKYKQLVDKDLPAQEKLTRDLQDTQKVVETLTATNSQLALENAFLKDNTYTWHNPESALKLVDMTQVEIGADGKVTGLKDALKALATTNGYLVKTDTDDKPLTPGGTAPGNNGGNGGTTPNSKALAARFPAMRTRVKRG